MSRTEGDASKLYLIIKGEIVPRNSPQFAELERIKSEADYQEVHHITALLPRDRRILVCGGSRWISVHAQYMELRRRGYDARVYEPASYTLDYDGA